MEGSSCGLIFWEVLRKTTVDPQYNNSSLSQNFNLQTQIWSRSGINLDAVLDNV